jgi:acetyltransferase
VTIRPLRPEDMAIERAFVTGLSEQTRHNRLLGGAVRITDEYIRRLTHIDWSREAALAAVTMIEGEEKIIAVARFVVDAGGKDAEFALVVADAWQRCGIGNRMMEQLEAAARGRSLARLYGDVLSVNAGMLALAKKRGYRRSPAPGDATVTRVALELG